MSLCQRPRRLRLAVRHYVLRKHSPFFIACSRERFHASYRSRGTRLGTSGLAYDAVHNVLLVASSTDEAIYQIPNAATATGTESATLLFQDTTHLHGPLDLSLLPNGHLLLANSDGSNVDPNQPSELVEYSAAGAFRPE